MSRQSPQSMSTPYFISYQEFMYYVGFAARNIVSLTSTAPIMHPSKEMEEPLSIAINFLRTPEHITLVEKWRLINVCTLLSRPTTPPVHALEDEKETRHSHYHLCQIPNIGYCVIHINTLIQQQEEEANRRLTTYHTNRQALQKAIAVNTETQLNNMGLGDYKTLSDLPRVYHRIIQNEHHSLGWANTVWEPNHVPSTKSTDSDCIHAIYLLIKQTTRKTLSFLATATQHDRNMLNAAQHLFHLFKDGPHALKRRLYLMNPQQEAVDHLVTQYCLHSSLPQSSRILVRDWLTVANEKEAVALDAKLTESAWTTEIPHPLANSEDSFLTLLPRAQSVTPDAKSGLQDILNAYYLDHMPNASGVYQPGGSSEESRRSSHSMP